MTLDSKNIITKIQAFSLIELIIVVIVITLLSGAGFGVYSRYVQSSRDDRRMSDAITIQQALEDYRKSNINDSFPLAVTTLVPDFLQVVPQDPQTHSAYSLYYRPIPAAPVACTDSLVAPVIACTSYSFAVFLEASDHYLYLTPYTVDNFPNSVATPAL